MRRFGFFEASVWVGGGFYQILFGVGEDFFDVVVSVYLFE